MNDTPQPSPPAATDGDPSKAELEVIGILNGRVVITKTTPIEIQQDMDNKLQVLRAHTRAAVAAAEKQAESERDGLRDALSTIEKAMRGDVNFEHAVLTEETGENCVTCGKIARAALRSGERGGES